LDVVAAWAETRDLPAPTLATALAIAEQLDRSPGSAALWAQAQRAITALLEADGARERAVDRGLRGFIAECRTIEVAEAFRAERCRAAIQAGDEREARRWARLVPEGCARGDHRWKTWPAGRVSCIDCQVEPVSA